MEHPANVHFFKNFIWKMQKLNHDVMITARDKEVTLDLLNAYGFNYTKISKMKMGSINLIYEWVSMDIKLLNIALKFKPDIMLGVGSPCIAHVSRLTNALSIIFTDYPLWYDKVITYPFSDIILTPTSFSENLGKKHLMIKSYKELAYLHPDFFKPNKKIYELMNINENERFVIMRFASFDAVHDGFLGFDIKAGFDTRTKIELVNQVIKYARVFIVPAGELPEELNKYRIQFPLEKIHDALYYADLLISDSQTMTTEAAVLGTPVVRCNSWVGEKDAMNFIELEDKYKLIYNFKNAEGAINKCIELLEIPDIKKYMEKGRKILLTEKINMTNFLIWLVENYDKFEFNMMQDYYTKYVGEFH